MAHAPPAAEIPLPVPTKDTFLVCLLWQPWTGQTADAKPKEGSVLAYGETTGHKHQLSKGKLFESKGQTFAVLEEPTELVHEEHGKHVVQPGVYEVIIQSEWQDDGPERVMD